MKAVAVPVCAVLALLSAVAGAARLLPGPVVTGVSVVATAGCLVVARRSGLTAEDLGLSRAGVRTGARWAVVWVVAVGVGYALAATLPATRDLFGDRRYHYGPGQAVAVALVLVPLRTVLLEEVAFRGVLWALVRRARGPALATAASSTLFGLWHVVSAFALAGSNRMVAERDVTEGVVVGGTVLLTAVAGVVLCEVRRRSASLLPAVALHWAVNGLGVITTALVVAP